MSGIMDYVIRRECPGDYRETENVVREAFWNVYRPGCTEHFVLHCLREDPDFLPELDLVLEKDGKIIGQIMYMHAQIETDDGKSVPVLTMGPLGILPEYQRMGYGQILLEASLEKAAELGGGAVCIEGNPDFYGKSGFVPGKEKEIYYPEMPREAEVPFFLVRELQAGYLDEVIGVYHTPDGYFTDEKEAEKFDEQFPHKEKLKLPGQLV